MSDFETAAKGYVLEALPGAVCLLGRVSGRYRIYRDGGDRSSYIGTGRNEKAAWLSAASFVAGKER